MLNQRIIEKAKPKPHGGARRKVAKIMCYSSLTNCECQTNVICASGYLTNKTAQERKLWVEKKSELFLTECSENRFEKETNRYNLEYFLGRRSQYDLYESSKTIDIRLYFASTLDIEKPFLGWVGFWLNPVTGQRLFKQSAGISIGVDNKCYVIHEGLKLTLEHYLEISLTDILLLKENIKLKPAYLVFHLLKIGGEWSDETRRARLVRDLSLNAGVLSYDFFKYSNKPYTLQNIVQAKNNCLNKSNSMIPLNLPVYIGFNPSLKAEYQYNSYPSILSATKITGLCINQIVYTIFTEQYMDQDSYLLGTQNYDRINKTRLTTINADEKTNMYNFVHYFLQLKEKIR